MRLCTHIETNRKLACKFYDLRYMSMKSKSDYLKFMKRLDAEIKIMRQCDHENIVKFERAITMKDTMCLLMEYLDGEELFDVITSQHVCSAGQDQCLHSFAVWQVWVVDKSDELVVLGDLSSYVSLSGYRWRLPANSTKTNPITSVIAVGEPGEVVRLTYLRKSGSRWLVHVMPISIGSDGRAVVVLK